MPDRHWQHGTQQAVEAKEGLPISGEGRSLASLSFQRFFRLYPHLAGMTGTALRGRSEFEQTYRLPVRVIPSNRPSQRVTLPMQVYATSEQRWQAVADSVQRLHDEGRPVLVGTRTVECSQRLSRLLAERGLAHQVLNAIHHAQEAAIIAQAGQRGAITVATNMAGRGTDIKLGPGVEEIGGLHVIVAELQSSGRADQQLVGRAGRQGDQGSSQIFASVEDELLAKHCPRLLRLTRRRFNGHVGPIGSTWVRGIFRRAQHRAEAAAFEARKMILRRDDWLEHLVPG
jgi:preprotein translocase subunit SecA